MFKCFQDLAKPFGAVLIATALAACSDSVGPPAVPTIDRVAGVYQASPGFGALSFTTTANGQTTDWLAQGGSVQLQLGANGSTSGRLFVPGADEDGGDFDMDLAGTWSIAAGKVQLTHPADTFLRDMPFSFREDRLEGELTVQGTLIRVVLVRS